MKIKNSNNCFSNEYVHSKSSDVSDKAMLNLEVNPTILSNYMSSEGKILLMFYL